MRKQVDKNHYEFVRYLSKRRWASIWHQLDEVINLKPERVLEVGPGAGVFKLISNHFGVMVETLDIDPELMPDHIASAERMPFDDSQYDVVCAFQMLEHLPFEKAVLVFNEMVRVSKKYIVISLPDARKVWRYSIYIPKFGNLNFSVPKPIINPPFHQFDGQHYWELNKKGFKTNRVIGSFFLKNRLALIKNFRVYDNPYHHFFVFMKNG